MHLNYNKKIISIFTLFFLANILFFLMARRYEPFENGVYIRYFESMFKDQDFNIFNQYTGHFDQWLATTTYNHPDYHSPFISSLLIIPYLFTCLFTLMSPADLSDRMMASYYFFTLILFSFSILEGYYEEHPKLASYKEWFYLLIFATGSLWFIFFDPTELSGICLIFSIIIFFELYKFWKDGSENLLTLSLAIGYFSILKPDGIFYAIALILMLSYQKKWKMLAPIMLSLIFFQSQILIVNYVRYGTLLAKNPVIAFDHTYLMDYLVGPNGLLTKTPIHTLLLIIMLYRCFTSTIIRERYLLSFALIITLTKAVLVSFAITPVTDYVANRHAIAELPFFAYALFSLFNDKRKIGRLLLALFIIWNIYDVYGIFINEVDNSYPYFVMRLVPFEKAASSFHFLTAALNYSFSFFKDNQNKILILSFQSSVFLTFCYFLHSNYKHHFRNVFLGFLIFITASFTFVDFANNKSHSAVLKQKGIFKNTVIVKGNAIYYDEAFSMIEHMLVINKYYNKPDMSFIDKFETDYVNGLYDNIVYDPTNFSSDLRKKIFRPSLWELKSRANALEKTFP